MKMANSLQREIFNDTSCCLRPTVQFWFKLDEIKSVMRDCLTGPLTVIYWDNITSLQNRGFFSFANDIDRASSYFKSFKLG